MPWLLHPKLGLHALWGIQFSWSGARPGIQPIISLKVNTKICSHTSCQPQTEFESALIQAFAKGEITRDQWTESRPPYKTHYYGIDNSTRKPWCYGNMLIKSPSEVPGSDVVREPLSQTLWFPVDGETFKPYTEWCKHENDEACLNSSAAPLCLYVLTARSIIQRDVLKNIRNVGWAKCMEEKLRTEGIQTNTFTSFAPEMAPAACRTLKKPRIG
jgi:hypothetical protein